MLADLMYPRPKAMVVVERERYVCRRKAIQEATRATNEHPLAKRNTASQPGKQSPLQCNHAFLLNLRRCTALPKLFANVRLFPPSPSTLIELTSPESLVYRLALLYLPPIPCHEPKLSKRVQRYFGNEQRERHRGRLASTTWRIVIWKRP